MWENVTDKFELIIFIRVRVILRSSAERPFMVDGLLVVQVS